MISIIAILYFNSISQTIFESKKDKMRSFASSIAADVIQVHMHGGHYSLSSDLEYQVGLYSNKHNLLYGNKFSHLDFDKTYYEHNKSLYITDQSTQMHLGVKYIVIKDHKVYQEIKTLKQNVIMYALLIILIIAIIGYFLSKLFLKPIANEREKLDNFIKNTTHELNTPITALLMSISSIKDSSNIKAIKRVKISANRISHIYSDLCYLMKKDINEQQPKENINLKDIINEQILLFDGYAKSKQIDFNTNINNFDYYIDRESIKRVVSNIISNALKYSKPNNKIDIQLNNNILTIKDYGIGIKTNEIQNITNRYYRSSNQSEGGFGIGLDIVNGICKSNNITLEIESQFSQWTKLTLTF